MSNIVRFAQRARAAHPAAASGGIAPLLASFAHHRRQPGDAYWLKENGELLGVLSALNRRLPELALSVYQPFVEGAADMVAFHPQYARLILNLITSLEDLGYPGGLGARLADWMLDQGLVDAEVNDLQRAELRFLMARHGRTVAFEGLDERLTRFMSRPETFAIPNPRAAYDLLHAVFYLSDYGRKPLKLQPAVVESLLMLGSLSHLEGNGDLLGEVCLALHYAGEVLPPLWLRHLRAENTAFRISPGTCPDSSDCYHIFLVNQWLFGTIEDRAFGDAYSGGPMSIQLNRPAISPLREWSQALRAQGNRRSADWSMMRSLCRDQVSENALARADLGAAESPMFDRFFARFARASRPVPIWPEARPA